MKYNLTPEQQARFDENVRRWKVKTGEYPNVHGPLPFRMFDPGPGDPWRELNLVDANNRCVTTLGPLEDPTEMTLGNALFIMECCNNYEALKKKVEELEAKLKEVRSEM